MEVLMATSAGGLGCVWKELFLQVQKAYFDYSHERGRLASFYFIWDPKTTWQVSLFWDKAKSLPNSSKNYL